MRASYRQTVLCQNRKRPRIGNGPDYGLVGYRQLGKRFGDAAYAVEELIAELGSTYTMAGLELELAPRKDHAQYIQSWLRALKTDKRAIFTAASKAQQAADFLAGQPGRTAEAAA